MGLPDGLAGETIRGRLTELDFRVAEEQTEEFASGVAGRPGNGDPHRRDTSPTYSRMAEGRSKPVAATAALNSIV